MLELTFNSSLYSLLLTFLCVDIAYSYKITYIVTEMISNENDWQVILISFPQAGSDVLACLSIDGAPQVTHSYNTVDHLRESPLDLVSNSGLILRFASTYFLIGVQGSGKTTLWNFVILTLYTLLQADIVFYL